MKFAYSLICSTLVFLGRVAAWGEIGHEAVGYIAMEFLAPNAAAFVTNTIPAKYNNNLGPAAPWADDVRHLRSFSWSAPFHFFDSNGKHDTLG
jgi:hypothetical protein